MEKLVLNAEDKNLDFVLASIRKSMETHNCSDEEAIMAVLVSAEEIYTNISHYAYPSGEDRSVEITVETSEHLCHITYKDSGIPYNPLEAEAPDISLDVMDMPVGGLGIFMVREMMDVITYRYKNEHNILTMEKRYQRFQLEREGKFEPDRNDKGCGPAAGDHIGAGVGFYSDRGPESRCCRKKLQ